MKNELEWKIVLGTVALFTMVTLGLLLCVQADTIARLTLKQQEQQETIDKLQSQLTQLQYSYLGHVSNESDFQQAVKEAAAGTSNWWAYVRLHRAQERAAKRAKQQEAMDGQGQ